MRLRKNKTVVVRRKPMGIRRKRSLMVLVTGLALTGILAVGSTYAYLTDVEQVQNQFTIGKVAIELTEPGWKPAENLTLEAGKTVKKDPVVTNVGINDAYVYQEIKIPMADLVTVKDDGTRLNNGQAVHQQVFTFQAKTGWTQISKKEVENNMIYTFSYDAILKPGEKTNPIFDNVVFANVVEGQIDKNQYNIDINAYAIQTLNTGDGSGDIKFEAKAAYEKYMNQNPTYRK